MNREQIETIIGGLADRHITAAAEYDPSGASMSPERITKMKLHHFRKPVLIAAVVALALALGVTAYAAGWLAPIFHRMQGMTAVPDPEREALYKAAEQAVIAQDQMPETVTLPDFDQSRITISERYYDGKTLLLGVDLEEATPALMVGYEPDTALREKISSVAFFQDVNGDDDLDALLAQGMERQIYDEYLTHRSANAAEENFRHVSAIEFDAFLQRKLSPEDYAAAWKMLRETGHLCVIDSAVYIGDHVYLDDGTDLGPVSQQNMDSFDIDAHSGNLFIEASSLPEAARDLDVLNASLTIKSSRTYYYMELGGPAYFYYETVDEIQVPFTVENSGE